MGLSPVLHPIVLEVRFGLLRVMLNVELNVELDLVSVNSCNSWQPLLFSQSSYGMPLIYALTYTVFKVLKSPGALSNLFYLQGFLHLISVTLCDHPSHTDQCD